MSELLESLCVTYAEISQTTTDPESLFETQRKQNLTEGLCNVSDETFNFFMYLERISRELLTYETLQENGQTCTHMLKWHFMKMMHLLLIL